MQEYLDIVKLNNAGASEELSAIVTEALTKPTTVAAPAPTLSSDPFQAPNTESTVSVVVKVDEHTTPDVKVEESTASVVKVLADLVHSDVTSAPVLYVTKEETLPPAPTTTPPPPPSLGSTESTTQIPTTQAAISEIPSTTTTAESTTTTAESTTTVTTTTAKKEDSDESKESGEEEDENKVWLFVSLKM